MIELVPDSPSWPARFAEAAVRLREEFGATARSASSPYARLQGGVPHHLTPEQEAQHVLDSPAPPGPPGR